MLPILNKLDLGGSEQGVAGGRGGIGLLLLGVGRCVVWGLLWEVLFASLRWREGKKGGRDSMRTLVRLLGGVMLLCVGVVGAVAGWEGPGRPPEPAPWVCYGEGGE
jgi:hypothetical protein